jgi:hypothetical protein
MFEYIARNFATIITGAVVFGIVFAAVRKMIKDHKAHKLSCGCGCDDCPSSGICHRD